jgi:hypothetical protein
MHIPHKGIKQVLAADFVAQTAGCHSARHQRIDRGEQATGELRRNRRGRLRT